MRARPLRLIVIDRATKLLVGTIDEVSAKGNGQTAAARKHAAIRASIVNSAKIVVSHSERRLRTAWSTASTIGAVATHFLGGVPRSPGCARHAPTNVSISCRPSSVVVY
jgi:hypothetical protein